LTRLTCALTLVCLLALAFTLLCLLPLACNRAADPSGVGAAAGAEGQPTIKINMFETKVVMLGTGTPNADPLRSGPAVAVIANGTPYLVDAGPGIVRRAAAACERGVEPLRADNLRRVFITHLHSDHTVGLPDLIYTCWTLERGAPLEAYGPPGLARMIDHVQQAWQEDVRLRLDGLEPANDLGWRVEVHEIAPGVIYTDDNVRVTAIPVKHGTWKHAYAYRFDARGRSIVISGDTTPCPELVEAARGCDLLVHEVYSTATFATRPAVWQQYHAAFHTSTHELAEIAKQVRPRLLVLYHQLYWGATDQDLLDEIAAKYDGAVKSAVDLGVY